MHNLIHEEVVELLLASISSHRGDEGLQASFYFGKPGEPHWQKRGATEIYYYFTRLIRAVLHVRRHGPAYLKYLAMNDIQRMLQQFVIDNFWFLANDVFGPNLSGSFAENVSQSAKRNFAAALATSPIFKPNADLTLFPLCTVKVDADFVSDAFFLIAPKSLDETKLPSEVSMSEVTPDTFPPLADWKGRKEVPSAWLGIRSPAYLASNKMKAAILGALALTPLPRYRHLFSGRTVIKGRCTFANGTTTSYDEAHTPPLMHDIVVGERDAAWLSTLATKLTSNERVTRRQLRALEYFYRAWSLDESERFPVLCMTLDAIFGDPKKATQSIIDGVREVTGSNASEPRLRLLSTLRGDVIHGRAPDVYDSEEYGRYFDKYGADPIHDMELVTSICLRGNIFGKTLGEHVDPNEKIILAAQASGRLPKVISRKSILDDLPLGPRV
jgi:hypothetical protein